MNTTSKAVALGLALTLVAPSVMAGGMAEPIAMAPVEIIEDTAGSSSSAGLIVPLILIALIAAAAGSSSGGEEDVGGLVLGDLTVACDIALAC